LKETYENIYLLLKAISYSKCGWKICGDLTVMGLFLGIQSGYIMFCCFLRELDSRAKDKHNKIKDWPMRETSVPRDKFVRHQLLVDEDKNLLPPLHIKCGLIKNFKVMNKYGKGFAHLREKFPETH
jgi:hypothetical protein